MCSTPLDANGGTPDQADPELLGIQHSPPQNLSWLESHLSQVYALVPVLCTIQSTAQHLVLRKPCYWSQNFLLCH